MVPGGPREPREAEGAESQKAASGSRMDSLQKPPYSLFCFRTR